MRFNMPRHYHTGCSFRHSKDEVLQGHLLARILLVLQLSGLQFLEGPFPRCPPPTHPPPREIPDLKTLWHCGWQGSTQAKHKKRQQQKPTNNRAYSARLGKKDTKPFKHNLCTFMALYNNSKDCSCVCTYISIIRHFSESIGTGTWTLRCYWTRVVKCGRAWPRPDRALTATPGHTARLCAPPSRRRPRVMQGCFVCINHTAFFNEWLLPNQNHKFKSQL